LPSPAERHHSRPKRVGTSIKGWLRKDANMTILKVTKYTALGLAVLGNSVVVAAAGDFDPSYNGLGFTRDFIPDSSTASDLSIDSTGRIVNAGNYYSLSEQSEHLVVWRRLADGTPDAMFGGTGVVYPISPPGLVESSNNSIAIDNQDRIVMVTGTETGHLVHRLNVDGTPDLSFSGTGHNDIPLRPRVVPITGVAIQPNNQIVAVAGAVNPASGHREFVVYRLQENGNLDPNFGGTGVVYTEMTPGGGLDAATGVALQPDGKIVVAGRARSLLPGSYYDFALARYLATGVLDPDFGSGGKVIFSILDDDFGRRVVVQPDGKIVIAGSVCVDLGSGNSYCYLGAARVDERGALDPSFAGTGKVYTDVGGTRGGSAFNVALQSDNKIIVVGVHQLNADSSLMNAILLRYQPDGSLDPTFGLNGISETGYGYSSNFSGAVRIQSDGQIVVSGSTGRDPIAARSVVTARYLASDNLFPRAAGTAILPSSSCRTHAQ